MHPIPRSTSRSTPRSTGLALLLLALGGCDEDGGRTQDAGPVCVDAKCEDPTATPMPAGGEALVCLEGTNAEHRVDACQRSHPDSPLWSKARPDFAKPDDPLYYVNRWHSIDPCFLDGTTSLPTGGSLARAQDDFDMLARALPEDLVALYGVESYGLGLAVRPSEAGWRSCADKALPMPALVGIPGGASIRADAWQSPLPEGWPPEAGYIAPEDGSRIQGFRALFLAAADQRIVLSASSGYRSATMQVSTFQGWVDRDGIAMAETYSAHPLHSEHQLGTAIDMQIDGLADPIGGYPDRLRYANSTELEWVRTNAHRFGVVLSYPVDRVTEHQYVPEPWHFRYVGVEAATLMHECGLSTEELMQGMYGDELPPLPPFEHMDLVTENVSDVGYDASSCWYQ